MRVLEGKSVFSGIAIGKISILQKADTSVKRTKVENPEAEITRVQEAKEKAVEQLQKLYDKALREVGESGAAIFEVHQMMLDDEDYLDPIDNNGEKASAHGAGGEGELERLGLCRSAAEGGQGNDESCQCTLEHDDPPEKRGLT